MIPAAATEAPVVLVVTDVQGSTPLWERLGLRFRDALDVHDAVIRGAIARHEGYEVRTEGDAFVVAFAEARQAIAFCVDAQQALHDAAWPASLGEVLPPDGAFRGLRVRMGAYGAQAERGQDPVTGRWTWSGSILHRATRISAAAHGGQILADEATAAAAPEEALRSNLGEYLVEDAAMALVQVVPPALAARTFGSLRAVRHRRTNLPAPATALLGREAELAQVDAAWSGGARWISVVGTAGAGKTRLAVEWASRRVGAWSGGTWFVDASAARDAAGLLGAVSAVLELGDNPTEARLRGAFRDRGAMWLVLDPLEHVQGAGEAIRAWLEASPGLGVLATSRSALGAEGEAPATADERGAASGRPAPAVPSGADGSPLVGTEGAAAAHVETVVKVGPLSTTEADPAASPAVRLFLERARAAAPAFDAASQLDAVVRLVARLDGLPLAIELAAARAAVLSPQQVLDRLERRFDLLRAGGVDRPARQRSLGAALEASWELLPEEDREVLAAASVFRGSFDGDAAAAVIGPHAVAAMARLAAASLATPLPEGRWRLLESVQQYAASKLREAERFERAHAAWYLTTVPPEKTPGRRAQLIRDGDNLLVALQRALKRRDAALAAALVISSSDALIDRDGADAIVARLQETLRLDLTQDARARVLDRMAQTMIHRGQPADALGMIDEAVQAAESTGDAELIARSLLRRANGLRMVGQPEASRATVERSMAIAKGRFPRLERQLWASLAAIDFQTGNWQSAFDGFEKAAAAALAEGSPHDWSESWGNSGVVLSMWGRRREARERFDAVLDVVRPRGARHQEAAVVNVIASTLALDGMLEAGERAANDARALHTLLGNRRGQGVALSMLANVLLAGGRVEEAEARAREALALHRAVANATFVAQALTVLASIALEQGRFDGASVAATEARDVAAGLGDPHLEAGANALLAEAGAHSYPRRELLDQARAAADALVGLEAWPDVVVARCREARVARLLGDAAAAEAALVEAEAIVEEQHLPERTVPGRDLARTRIAGSA